MVSTPRRETRVGKEEEAPMSKAEENKALVRHFFEARGKTDLEALDKMLAADFVCHTKLLPGQPPTVKTTSGRSPSFLSCFPTAGSSSRSK
jgi:ketosteroid isomerase-like protein